MATDTNTIAGLRENKAAVVEYLRGRSQLPRIQFSSLPNPIGWKTEKLAKEPSFDAERRFGSASVCQPHVTAHVCQAKSVLTLPVSSANQGKCSANHGKVQCKCLSR